MFEPDFVPVIEEEDLTTGGVIFSDPFAVTATGDVTAGETDEEGGWTIFVVVTTAGERPESVEMGGHEEELSTDFTISVICGDNDTRGDDASVSEQRSLHIIKEFIDN